MAHFARLDENNIVTMVAVVSNDDMVDENGNEVEALGVAVCEKVVGAGPWIQTSYNGNLRKQYAGIGFTYDGDNDVFIAPSPFPSWTLNDQYEWEAPVAPPTVGGRYLWDEETGSWVADESDLPADVVTDVTELP